MCKSDKYAVTVSALSSLRFVQVREDWATVAVGTGRCDSEAAGRRPVGCRSSVLNSRPLYTLSLHTDTASNSLVS